MAVEQSHSMVMISRSRSAPNDAAISMEWTTSANKTVTCLYSAARAPWLSGLPHSLQNFAVAGNGRPHDQHDSSAVVIPVRPFECGPRPYRDIARNPWSTNSRNNLDYLLCRPGLPFINHVDHHIQNGCWTGREPQRHRKSSNRSF